MQKYYSLTVYNVRYDEDFRGQLVYLDDIIVTKGLHYATDVLTQQKIEIIPEKAFMNEYRVLLEQYHKKDEFFKTGYHLVVLKSDFNKEHLATQTNVDFYIYDFENSPFQRAYETIKEKTGFKKETKEETPSMRLKQVRGTKR